MDVRPVGAQDRQSHRLGTRRQQETVVSNGIASGDDDISGFAIDRGDIAVDPKVGAGLRVKTLRAQRQPAHWHSWTTRPTPKCINATKQVIQGDSETGPNQHFIFG